MIKWLIVIFMLIVTLLQSAYAADEISGSAQIIWRSGSETTENKKEKLRSLNQTYNLGLRKDITSKINFSADVGVNATETEETGTDEQKTTRLFPRFRLNITNDYFDANGGYQLNERGLDVLGMTSDESRLTTENWNANFITRSVKYPKLQFRYDENRTYDYELPHETDTRSEIYEATADYTYKFLNFTARRSENEIENFVQDKESTETATTSEGRVEFRKSFWGNRITSSGNYRWTEQETERVAIGAEARFLDERDRWAGLYVLTGTGALDDTPALIDGNIAAGAGIDIGSSGDTDQNIGAELVRTEEVEEIWIYTEQKYTDNTNTPVQWDVYLSDDDNVTWDLIETNATSEYIQEEQRFKISFTPTSAKFFKVVNTTKASFINLYVTEIKLFGTTIEPVSTHTRENIIFDAGIRPVDWMRVTYNFTQDKSETDPDSRTTRLTAHNISARADADLHKYLKAWAQYQKRLEYDDTESDRRSTDTYSLHFDSSPLETLNSSLSINHSAPKKGSVTQSRTTSSLLHIAAELREGVDLSVDGNLNYTENLVTPTETFIRTVNSDLRLKLTRALTTEIKYTTDWTTTCDSDNIETSARNSTVRTDLYYRPVRSFYFRWSYELQRSSGGEESTVNQYNINWVMTEKLRLNMDYRIDRNSEVKTIYSADLAWNLSKVFVLRCEYDRSRREADTLTKTQTFTTILSARF